MGLSFLQDRCAFEGVGCLVATTPFTLLTVLVQHTKPSPRRTPKLQTVTDWFRTIGRLWETTGRPFEFDRNGLENGACIEGGCKNIRIVAILRCCPFNQEALPLGPTDKGG
jgi:hypothetical protein